MRAVRSRPDQRGTPAFPSYPRQSGNAVDIGAYEVQQDKVVFNAGGDGCVSLWRSGQAKSRGGVHFSRVV